MLSSSRKGSSGEASVLGSPGFSSNMGDNSASPHHSLPGSSHSSVNGPLIQNSSPSPSFMPHSANPTQLTPQFNPQPRRNLGVLPPCPNRPSSSLCQNTNGVKTSRETTPSIHPVQDSNFKRKESQSQPKKTPVKPMWVDVAVLPRIPKIKRESSNIPNDGTTQGGSCDGSQSKNSSSSARNGSGLPEGCMNNLSGDKGRQQSVDQQKSHSDSQAQRSRPDRASSSAAFSNSFSSSSGTSASQQQHASFSSSSSVSFRINSSGNSWHAKRLNIASSFPTGSNVKDKEDTKKKQLHKDKQKLLTSHAAFSEEQNDNTYDPFNPTLSDSSNSSDEMKSPSWYRSPQCVRNEERARISETKDSLPDKQDMVCVKTETQDTEISEEEPGSAQNTGSQNVKVSEFWVEAEEDSELKDVNTEKPKESPETNIKQEPYSDESEKESESHDGRIKSESENKGTTPPVQQSTDQIKIEQKTEEEAGDDAKAPRSSLVNYDDDSSASSSTSTKNMQQEHVKSEFRFCPKSESKDSGHKKQTSKASKERRSSSSETDRGRREYRHGSEKRSKRKDEHKDSRSSWSQSRERRRAHSSSDSSQPNSPDRTHRKRRRSQSRSADEARRRRSR